jgi:hypothetical protein
MAHFQLQEFPVGTFPYSPLLTAVSAAGTIKHPQLNAPIPI